jgi:membrane protein CcdC involved in cytochrome C biogenesis
MFFAAVAATLGDELKDALFRKVVLPPMFTITATAVFVNPFFYVQPSRTFGLPP